MNIKKLWFLFFALFVMASGCGQNKKTIEEVPPMSEQTIERFTIEERESGKRVLFLEAESAVINDQNKTAYLHLPRVKFYRGGNYVSTLVTENARINLDTYDVICYGKCTIDGANGEHLETTDMRYDAKRKVVYSNNPVKMTRPDTTVYGTGFEADTELEKIVVKKQKIIINNKPN